MGIIGTYGSYYMGAGLTIACQHACSYGNFGCNNLVSYKVATRLKIPWIYNLVKWLQIINVFIM